jgi:hypothetical protein
MHGLAKPTVGELPMKSNLVIRLFFAGLCLVGITSAVSAQQRSAYTGGAKPVSNLSGYTGQEMSNIYNEAIGTGYTGQSLNNLALQNARAQTGYYGQLTTRSQPAAQPRVNYFQSGGSSLGKPFSGFSPSPTTSPYLNLFREDFAGNSDLNYNTLVRPQLQQQAFNQQVQRQGMEMARRMQSMAAQSDFNPQGDKNQYPTGHQTVMKYYGHFYPTAPYRPGKQAP